MKKTAQRLIAAIMVAAAVSAGHAASVYDQVILSDRPVMFLGMDTPASGAQADLSGGGNSGMYQGGTPKLATLPNGEKAADFNGSGQYLTVRASPALSVPTTKVLTVESWIKPGTLQFAHTENEGFVYFLGKGNPTNGYEYANRMYSLSNSASRPNRISDYAWNPSGGLGSGAYFQDAVKTTEWIMVTDVIDMKTGTISIYKNGALRGKVPLSQYNVTPGITSSPFNVGTRNMSSWFQGAVGKVAVYNYVLTDAQIANHYKAMTTGAVPAPTPTPTPVAVAPVVSQVAVTALTQAGATLIWNTDKKSHSQVEYGLTAAYGSLSPMSTATGLAHSMALSGLKAGTVYHYRVRSLDDATKLTGVSGDMAFTTVAPTLTGPAISAVSASGITQTSANVTWTTDKVSHSQVEYGLSATYGSLSYQSNATGTSHYIPLAGLQPGALYHYRVKSLDDATRLAGASGDFTFTTAGSGGAPAPAPAPSPAPGPSNLISNVHAGGITTSGATLSWNTTAVSHSQVEYGLTSSYGSLSYLSKATGVYHNLVLSALKAGTVYHYRVKSLDASGKTAVSGDFTFKTSATAGAAR